MKPTELMIGDKLKTVFNQKIVRVNEIKQNCLYTEDNGYEYNELEPIPLTEKILEMNGFTHNVTAPCGYYNASVYDMHDILFHVSGDTYEDTWHTEVFIDHNNNEYVLFNLCYVHELQHVLKLCSLNDLADNLKVEE